MKNYIDTKFVNKVLQNTDDLDFVEKTSLISIYIFIIIFGLLHAIFTTVFIYLGIPEMIFLNITSILICIFGVYIIACSKKLALGLFIGIANFCYYVVFSTYFLGYNKNATILLPILILLIHIIFPKQKKYLVANTAVVLVSYAINIYINYNVESKYSDMYQTIELSNNIFALCLVALVIFLKSCADKTVKSYTNKQIDILVEEVETLSEEASVDFLTGLWNRRYIEKKFEEEDFKDSYIVLADIDFFKSINDTYGHICGDYILKEVAHEFKSSFRNIDDVCRWGGEEFLIYITNASRLNVVDKLERIRRKIEKAEFECDENKFNITITFGFAKIDKSLDIEKNINRADTALYYGKKHGRNCVLSYLDVKDET